LKNDFGMFILHILVTPLGAVARENRYHPLYSSRIDRVQALLLELRLGTHDTSGCQASVSQFMEVKQQ